MDRTVKITPRVAAEVAQRLRLAAGMRSRSMSAMVNDALDQALPSLDEIGQSLRGRVRVPAPGAGAASLGLPAGVTAARPGPTGALAARGGPPARQERAGEPGDGSDR